MKLFASIVAAAVLVASGVVCGENYAVDPVHSSAIFRIKHIARDHARLPHSKLIRIPDANHVMVFTHPRRLCHEIAKFIGSEP